MRATSGGYGYGYGDGSGYGSGTALGGPADTAPAGTRYFRRAFDLPADEPFTAAQFELTADDSFTLHLNGKEIARSPNVSDSWSTAALIDVSADLRPGRDVIAVEATNAFAGPAGLIGRLRVRGSSGGDPFDLVTYDGWGGQLPQVHLRSVHFTLLRPSSRDTTEGVCQVECRTG
ncbi:hypothetical protein [Streptomyces sp. NBC_01429]|uniref:hypothetical protein n=1 Tax=Streptomyces sp. NBC_01429 TaxID=2903862 RepID=UPI002E28D983|nr:hypothetical protein [Streptomyces sp. NBC_01429]